MISAGLFPAKPKYITYEKYGAVGDGVHDFGYPCGLPSRITIENLTIDDSAVKDEAYTGPYIFGDLDRDPDANGLLPFSTHGTRTESKGYSCKFWTDGPINYQTAESGYNWSEAFGTMWMEVYCGEEIVDRAFIRYNGSTSDYRYMRGL